MLGEKDRKGPGKIDKEGESYRRNARIVMKLGRGLVYDLRGLDIELPPSPSLRLPVPFMGKRPGKRPRRLRPLRPAVLGEKDRKGPGKIDMEGEAYRRNARIVMKLGGGLVYDFRGLDVELPPSPSLRSPVPSMRKRPGKKAEAAEAEEADSASAKKIGRDREREDQDRRAYRRNHRMVMKFCRELDRERTHLPAKFRVPSSLRLPVPWLGKRPRRPRRLRPMGPAALGEKGR